MLLSMEEETKAEGLLTSLRGNYDTTSQKRGLKDGNPERVDGLLPLPRGERIEVRGRF
jgi:hypothetical protein